MEPGGYSSPSGRVWPTAGSESCVVSGRPGLRSVDSQSRSRVIEPRKLRCGSLRRGHSGGPGRAAGETRALEWYRQAKETKRGEMGGRKSEHLIVPWNQGNSDPGNPAEERRCRVVDPLEGNTSDA